MPFIFGAGKLYSEHFAFPSTSALWFWLCPLPCMNWIPKQAICLRRRCYFMTDVFQSNNNILQTLPVMWHNIMIIYYCLCVDFASSQILNNICMADLL